MSAIDPTIAAILDRDPASDDEDALIAALEEDDEQDTHLASLREQRREQLHAEWTRARALRESGAGTYRELTDEKTVLDLTTTNNFAVVHFYKSDFARCAVMDGHLEALAPHHLDTTIAKISVDAAPFLVTKLNIRVLPCVIAFVDGVSVDRIVGFEGLSQGSSDRFATRDLEARLLRAGVLARAKVGLQDGGGGAVSRGNADAAEDDDEWD